ncbi:MAG: hypothetical protein K2P81_04895 [Bacteriovoracaceae bacterium]|nr:hypothetical protein [Bacteriovoracaceae bacterium]
MSLKVLFVSPDHQKLFVDLSISSVFVKSEHPQLTIDVYIDVDHVPSWWVKPGEWFQLIHSLDECSEKYDLIIQAAPSEEMAKALLSIQCENRAGVSIVPNLHVQGRWAQTLLSQMGSRRFAPFTPYDLFNHVLLGRTTLDLKEKKINTTGSWIVDLDSLPQKSRNWGEKLIAHLSSLYPNRVLDKIPPTPTSTPIFGYVGSNTCYASWISSHGSHVALIIDGPLEPLSAPANSNSWIMPQDSLLDVSKIHSLFASSDLNFQGAYRLTNEYLGGQILDTKNVINDSEFIFEKLHYVVFNYLNDLLEIDIPIPEITAACCLKIKGIRSVFDKISHLNLFGIKFLQEFIDKTNGINPKSADVNEIIEKIHEIDQLTIKTMSVYREMDLLRNWIYYSKAGARGDNIYEISKSLILIFNEINQALGAYSELIDTIVKKHSKEENTVGP